MGAKLGFAVLPLISHDLPSLLWIVFAMKGRKKKWDTAYLHSLSESLFIVVVVIWHMMSRARGGAFSNSQWISSWLSCIYLIFDEIFYLVFGNVAQLINEIPFTWFGSPCHYVGLNVLGSIIHFLIYYYGWIIELTKTKRSLYIGKLD